ncbi:Glutathione S-transferase 1 [Aphelenchoides avenae]|nr:Glutathione S-transferase 1 [Aphelenchus avenae]
MVPYKLVYFDVRGWAEPARMILHHAGVGFEDVRVLHADWPGDLKAKAPFGKLPYLEVDGKQLPQSYAISRYLARKYDLAGKDEWEQAWLDAIADAYKDVDSELRPYFVAAHLGREDKDKLCDEVFKPCVQKFIAQIEGFLKDSASGFLVKSGYTWVDFLFAELLSTFENLVPGLVSKNDAVWTFVGRVHDIPKLKEYLASRKVTLF